MTQRKTKASPDLSFTPVATRVRHDGWTHARQQEFIEALAESGCVLDACRRTGMSAESAYRLRRRVDAQSFRLAWDAALDYAIRRLSDAAYSRAINGVAVPHYYKGELVGEHRRYDEKLTMFLLRYRDPLRYAKSHDRAEWEGHDELFAIRLARHVTDLSTDESQDRARRRFIESFLADPDADEGGHGSGEGAWPPSSG